MMRRYPIKWGGGLYWTSTGQSYCCLVASLRDGRWLLRHEMQWAGESPDAAASALVAFMRGHRIEECGIYSNSAIWPQDESGGETVSETFQAAGVILHRGSSDRVNGLSRVKALLAVKTWNLPAGGDAGDETIPTPTPTLLIHPECEIITRIFPRVTQSRSNPEDIDTLPDHYPIQALMFFAMSRPIPTPQDDPELPPNAIGHWVNELRDALPPPPERPRSRFPA